MAMRKLDPRIERLFPSGMFSVFVAGEGFYRFDTLEAARAFLRELDRKDGSA